MMYKFFPATIFASVLSVVFLLIAGNIILAGDVQINIEILGICGNNIKEWGEQCDGIDLGGQNCLSRGYTGGDLTCNIGCTFNVTECTSSSTGGGIKYNSPTSIVFSGKTYPFGEVNALKDAQIAATTFADKDGNFQLTLSDIFDGNYIFALYSKDNQGTSSPLLLFPTIISSGAKIQFENIFIAPTIRLDKEEVKKGDNIIISGQSALNSDIAILLSDDRGNEFSFQIRADGGGLYSYILNTDILEMKKYSVRARASLNYINSSISKSVSFLVGTKNTPFTKIQAKGDLSGDGKVDLVDFSMLIYWFDRFPVPQKVDLNGDGKIDLVDFSIMAFNWTG